MPDEKSQLAGTASHLSATEMQLWTGFLDASRIIETELEAQLSGDFDMTHREYEVLVRIDGAGGHMRMSTLARQIEASPQLVSQTVDRLAERGWVKRQPSPTDRRGVEAALTTDGRSKLAQAAGPHAELVRQLLIQPMDSKHLQTVAASIGATADHLRRHRSGKSCADPNCSLGSQSASEDSH